MGDQTTVCVFVNNSSLILGSGASVMDTVYSEQELLLGTVGNNSELMCEQILATYIAY